MAYELTEQKKVGLGLIGFGLFFTFLGVILFFDRGLLALGNVSYFQSSMLLSVFIRTLLCPTYLMLLLYIVLFSFIVRILSDILVSWSGTLTWLAFYMEYFYQPSKLQGTTKYLLCPEEGSASFLLGLFFIFVRWPIIGILLEICGCFVLFGGFWPSIKGFLYQIPVLGWILPYPIMVLLFGCVLYEMNLYLSFDRVVLKVHIGIDLG
ncbi:Vesicle transport protein GOT1 [Cucurbita argyrosperma subsp. argyrosperma]|nr:Vesicle transport protein GOT1 [Cucurbita argyrosperma subsp. argyrosperma]